MSVSEPAAAPANAEAIEAWDGPLFERFVQYRHLIVEGLKVFGNRALEMFPPPQDAAVLDIGCGFGDSTQQIGELVGPSGSALGVDASPRFIAAAEREARDAGAENVSFLVADIQAHTFEQRFYHVFSRMGTMFFANPVAALRNVREAMNPGARLVMVVWRRKEENDWVWRAQQITERFVTKPETYDDPTCGPGPFSMGNADTVTGQLLAAGFEDVTLRRLDLPILMGRDVAEAAELTMAIGPAGEILRLSGERAAHLHGDVREALMEGFSDWVTPRGVYGPGSTWVVTAVPAA